MRDDFVQELIKIRNDRQLHINWQYSQTSDKNGNRNRPRVVLFDQCYHATLVQSL